MSTLWKHQNGFYYIKWEENHSTRRKSLRTKDKETAIKRYAAEAASLDDDIKTRSYAINHLSLVPKIAPKIWSVQIYDLSKDRKSWVYAMYSNAQHKARRKKLPFDITYKQFVAKLKDTNGYCQMTGIAFDFSKYRENRTSPYQPSLDRINSQGGYSDSNCRIVCYCANLAMNQWGEKVLEEMAMAFAAKRRIKTVQISSTTT